MPERNLCPLSEGYRVPLRRLWTEAPSRNRPAALQALGRMVVRQVWPQTTERGRMRTVEQGMQPRCAERRIDLSARAAILEAFCVSRFYGPQAGGSVVSRGTF